MQRLKNILKKPLLSILTLSLIVGVFVFMIRPAEAATVTFLTTTGTNTWTVPGDWNNNNNKIEVIGGGAGGGNDGSAGGGGAYSKIANLVLTPNATVTYGIGTGGGTFVAGGNTWFNAANFGACVNSTLCASAQGGQPDDGTCTSIGAGGAAASGIGTTKFSGGAGGDCSGNGSGGGGAAGLNGNGNNGITANPGTGGSGDAGFGGSGGAPGNPAGVGGDGTEWDSTHGSGGGGGGNSITGQPGGNGGSYGGGGGGAPSASGGSGIQGLVVVTYVPLNHAKVTVFNSKVFIVKSKVTIF